MSKILDFNILRGLLGFKGTIARDIHWECNL